MERMQIDAINDRADLVTLAEQAGAKLHKNGGEFRCACPIHGGHDATAFVIFRGEDGRQAWNCFSGDCGGGDAIAFVMKWRGIGFKDAVRFLGGEPMSAQEEARLAIIRAERAAQHAEQAAAQARAAVEALKSTEVWQRYHEQMDDEARQLWRNEGIPDDWQNIWRLGYCAEKEYSTRQGILRTESITIPMFYHGWEVANVKHRLLNPLDPNDKYRPEKSGLTMPPYICDPDMAKDKTERVLFVEGEKKAMVTYLTLDSPKWQVIGIGGKDAKKVKTELTQDYAGRNCVICLDPDAEKQAREWGREIGGKIILLPEKIDDLIVKHKVTKDDLRNLITQAERITK